MDKILSIYRAISHLLEEELATQGQLVQVITLLSLNLNNKMFKELFQLNIREGEKRDIKEIVKYLEGIKCPICKDKLYMSNSGLYCVECGYVPGDKY